MAFAGEWRAVPELFAYRFELARLIINFSVL